MLHQPGVRFSRILFYQVGFYFIQPTKVFCWHLIPMTTYRCWPCQYSRRPKGYKARYTQQLFFRSRQHRPIQSEISSRVTSRVERRCLCCSRWEGRIFHIRNITIDYSYHGYPPLESRRSYSQQPWILWSIFHDCHRKYGLWWHVKACFYLQWIWQDFDHCEK